MHSIRINVHGLCTLHTGYCAEQLMHLKIDDQTSMSSEKRLSNT